MAHSGAHIRIPPRPCSTVSTPTIAALFHLLYQRLPITTATMKWEEEGYTRKDEHGNMISIVPLSFPRIPRDADSICLDLTCHVGGV